MTPSRLPLVADEAAAVDRVHWRGGFGPAPADRPRLHADDLEASIRGLLAPRGAGTLLGPPPVVSGTAGSGPLQPLDRWGHDQLWWLDRMVRTDAPLVERMTLNLHDHFATSNDKVGNARLMLRQNRLLRRHALGNFGALTRKLLRDGAMQLWLDLPGSHRDSPNENFARELMELFTLGSGYRERDVREAARALTGFTYDWGRKRFGWDERRHDPGRKRIFGQQGRFRPDDVVRLCLAHRAHAPFLCTKVWSWFAPGPPPRATLRELVRVYRASGGELRPVVGAVLRSPALYANLDEPDMVKSPVVFLVGALRATGTPITVDSWVWLLEGMGQSLFNPPNVGGWPVGEHWLSTATVKARFGAVSYVLRAHEFPDDAVPQSETAEVAMADASAFAGAPWTSSATRSALLDYARGVVPRGPSDRHASAERRRVLRHLLLAGPDAQVH